MKNSVEFPGCNFTFTAPEGRDDVSDLRCFRNGKANVLAVKLTEAEKAEFLETGLIFVSVLSGPAFYPIYVGTESTVREVVADYGPVWKKGKSNRHS